MRRRRQGENEGHGNSERWLLTYSDMITLLMAFFIMMYSMSVLNLQKFNEVAISIRSGFGGLLTGKGQHLLMQPAGNHVPRLNSHPGEQQQLINARRRMESYVTMHNLTSDVEIKQEMRGLVISMQTNNVLFETGSAELKPRAFALLATISRELVPMPNDILVEGHTCSLPIATPLYPSNWELSSARASRVVRAMIHDGLPGWRLSAVGYADTRPNAPNDTEMHRKKNRRVDIVVLSSEHVPMKSAEASSPPPAELRPSLKPGLSQRVFLGIPKVMQH